MGVFPAALTAAGKGTDVYLFLTGMMLLSEAARHEGLFDALATYAVNAARGSPRRLFALVYAAGILTTALLSNDATAVVMTPAVLATARRARTNPLPLLFVCAFVANAASFILPISNPANLVVYGNRIPPLGPWLERLALPSIAAIVVTYAALRWSQRRALAGPCAAHLPLPSLTVGGWTAAAGIAVTAIALPIASWFGVALGVPTAICGVLTAASVAAMDRRALMPMLRGVQWAIVPLVAVLFILVEELMRSGMLHAASRWIENGVVIAVLANFINNLPTALLARSVLEAAHASARVADSLLIGVDLGPNLCVSGSLATILWLGVLRREHVRVSFGSFLRMGLLVMPPALLAALGARSLF